MHSILIQKKSAFEAAIDHLHKEFGGLRTGRATPALVEDIPVAAYDTRMELKGLASIQVQDARTLVIEPWDKNLTKNIEKAIHEADLGFHPIVDGSIIRIVMPLMTEENRKAMVKKMKTLVEEARVRARGAREDARETVIRMEKDKTISEDEKFKLFDEIDKMTKEYIEKLDAMGEKKEEEIMSV